MAEQEPREGAADREPRGRSGDRPPRAREAGARSPRSGGSGSGRRDGDRRPYEKRDGDRKPYEKRDGDRKPYEKRDGDRPYAKRDGDRKPYEKRDGDRKPYAKRDGDRPYAKRDGDRKPYEKREGDRPYAKRDGDGKPYEKRDGDRKPYAKRDGDRKPYEKRDGDRKPYEKRDGDRPYAKRDGDRKPYEKREGDRPYAKRDGDRKPYEKRDGDREPYEKRDGDRPYAKRDGDRPYAKRDGDRKPYGGRSDRPERGGANRPDTALRPEENRPVRARHDDPFIPEDVTPQDLNGGARNELKTLSKENAEQVARHLAMAAQLIDDDPVLAHQHALSASRRAGRIAIVRETLAITAYATGDYALALRELRTYRRISGKDDQIALMVDSERGVGRPDRALELGRSVDRSTLATEVRVELAIAMSGARLDLGDAERALLELDIPELDPDRAFEWSPALFSARATVLEELGRDDEAARWRERAEVAADVIDAASGIGDLETVYVDEIIEESGDEDFEPENVDAPDDDDAVGDSLGADEVAEILADAGIDDEDDDTDGTDEPEGPDR
ncbi:primosomal protein [Microbacterium sp. CFH 31415]|uniref:primosomal protein n=1 Tax=Microbacterium sp. CFH 31415 TaxID=2921732 RepID=UPI001F12BFA5|nr:primosomal protein [Microbacterium sp. CFH 31415]MCH6229896.1 primosomal protein [Microbacterium sp. CFH 31415]